MPPKLLTRVQIPAAAPQILDEISIFGVIFEKYVLLIFSRNSLRFSRLNVVKKTLT